uniref:Lon proteolytic domain-containing protein n=1 Tax=Meloidogyne javanica TaxID=6303 RepID=A0A915MFJ7_MELJA
MIEFPSIAATQVTNSASIFGNVNERLFEKLVPGLFPIMIETKVGDGFVVYSECVILKNLEGYLTVNGTALFNMKAAAVSARGYLSEFIKIYKLNVQEDAHFLLNFLPPEFVIDGQSGGAALTCCMLSMLLNIEPRNDIAVIGAISLKGLILEVQFGNKLAAAKRCGLMHIVMPERMRKKWDELPAETKEGLTAHFVMYFKEIFCLVFPGVVLQE